MTPRLLYNISKKTSRINKELVKYAAIFLALFLVAVIINVIFFDYLIAITLVPLGVLFSFFGIGIMQAWFKGKDGVFEGFESFWETKSFITKLVLWYCTIFMTFWFVGVVLISCFALVHTLLFVVSR